MNCAVDIIVSLVLIYFFVGIYVSEGLGLPMQVVSLYIYALMLLQSSTFL